LSFGTALIAAEMVPNSQGPGFLDTTRVLDGVLEQTGMGEAELTVAELVVVKFKVVTEITEMVDGSDDGVLLAVETMAELAERILLELTEMTLLDDEATVRELLALDAILDEAAGEEAICAASEACSAANTSWSIQLRDGLPYGEGALAKNLSIVNCETSSAFKATS
jgi:hypothetical protein